MSLSQALNTHLANSLLALSLYYTIYNPTEPHIKALLQVVCDSYMELLDA